jgi:hypothetical protein
LTSAELAALIISGLSLLVAFIALYRAELRGPSLKLSILRAPASWTAAASYRSPEMGRWEMYLHVSGALPLVVHNSGSRSGVIFDLEYDIDPIPSPFSPGVMFYLNAETLTVGAKATESIHCQVSFARENVTIAEGLRAFSASGPDFRVTIRYKANRGPFGWVRSGRATQVVSRRPITDCVNEWSKHPPTPPIT